MKYVYLGLIAYTAVFVWAMVYTPIRFDAPSNYEASRLPTPKMEIVECYNQYPLSVECIKSILRPCTSDKALEIVTYAWRMWGDMDFILTVDAESRFDHNAVGDQGRAFGFCQVRFDHNKWGYDRYKAMNTWQERLAECYRMYSEWKSKGIVQNRLYGYNVRHLNKSKIQCYD